MERVDRPRPRAPGCRRSSRRQDVTVILHPGPPFDWPLLPEGTRSRAVAGLERVDAGSHRRVMDDGRILEVASDGTTVEVRDGVDPQSARRVFDLDHDPAALAAAFGDDPVLGPRLARAPGIRVPGAWNSFEIALRAILGQQVSVAGARRTAATLGETLGEAAIPPPPG